MRIALCGLAASLLALPAMAQPVTGLYIGGAVGVNFVPSFGATASLSGGGASPAKLDIDPSTGYAVVGSVGWGYGNGLRAEVELNYRNNLPNRVTLGGNTQGAHMGILQSYGVMGNAFYDFQTNWRLAGMPVTPYLGAGVGYMIYDFDRVRNRLSTTARSITNDSDGRFAYQAIVGAAFGLDRYVPGLSATFEYRFLGTLAPNLSTAVVNNNGVAVSSGQFEPNVYNHSVLLGVRYAFNRPAPPPAPAPVAAPAPARTFLVFFDWDRADLTDRARQIIAEAAQNARTVSATRIEVSGHADRTGSAAYNQRLSVRRAEAVAAELVRRGISRNEMTIQGFGFDRPLVPTAMGVREPQNRRVEIVLR